MKPILLLCAGLLCTAAATAQPAERALRTEILPYDTRHDAEARARAKSGHTIDFRPAVQVEADGPLRAIVSQTVEIPYVWTDGTIYLHLENVQSTGQLWVNDQLAALLGLTDVEAVGMGRAAGLPQGETALAAFAETVKAALGIPQVLAVDGGRAVRRVLLIGGSGGSAVEDALASGCDTLLTGEAQHHELLLAQQLGLNLLVAGHFATENPAMTGLCYALQAAFGDCATCLLSQDNRDPAYYL